MKRGDERGEVLREKMGEWVREKGRWESGCGRQKVGEGILRGEKKDEEGRRRGKVGKGEVGQRRW